MIRLIMNAILRLLFYPSPKITITHEEERIFSSLLKKAFEVPDKQIIYNLSIPKYKFLHYLAANNRFLFHGSNNNQINSFEPRKQTLYDGKVVSAIFASKDPIWSTFYATLDKEKIEGNIRNGSVTTNGKKMFHFYSLTRETLPKEPWTEGMIYLLPKEDFSYVGNGLLQFDEWISHEPVSPIAKITVTPNDFYFLHKVSAHRQDESIAKTWLFYKMRTFLRGCSKSTLLIRI